MAVGWEWGMDVAAGTGCCGVENRTSGAGCGVSEDTKTDTENLPEVLEGEKMCATPLDARQGTAGWKVPKKRGTENLTGGL